jgi:hypothetical protein
MGWGILIRAKYLELNRAANEEKKFRNLEFKRRIE